MTKIGVIVECQGLYYKVQDTYGNIHTCVIRGKIRLLDKKDTIGRLTNPVAVGDYVQFLINTDSPADSSVITNILSRKNAKEKDLIFTSGNIGDAFLGLKILEKELKANKENKEYLISKYHKPTPRIDLGQNVRVFPISNWTELDVWSYIKSEEIEIPSIYFAHKRATFLRDGLIWSAEDDVVYRDENEEVEERMVRFRTVGDMSCTAAVLSDAVDINTVVDEIKVSTISERGARIDDKRSEAAMEKRKQQGYF